MVQRADNFIQWINPYTADKIGAFLILIGQRANFIHWIGIYQLDKVIQSSYDRAQAFPKCTAFLFINLYLDIVFL